LYPQTHGLYNRDNFGRSYKCHVENNGYLLEITKTMHVLLDITMSDINNRSDCKKNNTND